jgi:hypothetical protein
MSDAALVIAGVIMIIVGLSGFAVLYVALL